MTRPRKPKTPNQLSAPEQVDPNSSVWRNAKPYDLDALSPSGNLFETLRYLESLLPPDADPRHREAIEEIRERLRSLGGGLIFRDGGDEDDDASTIPQPRRESEPGTPFEPRVVDMTDGPIRGFQFFLGRAKNP